jgi:hypothetical protein
MIRDFIVCVKIPFISKVLGPGQAIVSQIDERSGGSTTEPDTPPAARPFLNPRTLFYQAKWPILLSKQPGTALCITQIS